MSSKRTIDDVQDSSTTSAPQTTADMAELLREKLVAHHETQRKKRRISKGKTINLKKINPKPNSVGFFKLHREIRDMIYQELWSATPKIKQRYKRRFYEVTYGDGAIDDRVINDEECSEVCIVLKRVASTIPFDVTNIEL